MTRTRHSSRRFALALLAAGAGFTALTASSEPRPPALEDAQKKAASVVKHAASLKERARPAVAQASAPAPRPRLAAATGTIQCQCLQWSESSWWKVNVCADERCWDRGPREGQCHCYQWKEVNYESQWCSVWTPNFCNFD